MAGKVNINYLILIKCNCKQGYSGEKCDQTCSTYRNGFECVQACPTGTFPDADNLNCIGCPFVFLIKNI